MVGEYGLANQKLCYFQIHKIFERKPENILEKSEWI